MRCSCAKRRRMETARVSPGFATASGRAEANHLSPAYCSHTAFSVRNSPGRSSRASLENEALRDIGEIIQRATFSATGFSVARQGGIDFARPEIDSTGEIVEIGKARAAQHGRRLRTANAVMAIDHDLCVLPFLDFVQAQREF